MLVFSSFQLDVANASLQRGKQTIFLTPKALNVLRYLVEHAGQLVTKDALWRAVWPGVSVTDATLSVCMSKVRKALGDDSKTPRYIETVHRLGYRFIAPVSTQSAGISGSAVWSQESVPARRPQSATPHFVGRDPELAQLHKWFERALEGERQIVFVTGEPGIGKTTLVEEFLQQEQVSHAESIWSGRGQCIEHYGTGEPYLPVLDALGRLCRGPGGEPLLELLDKHAPTWLVQMPGLVGAAEQRNLQKRVAGATQARMLRELAEALEVVSQERRLILHLEDLHWSDYSTLEWLGFLARRKETARLLVLGTYRPVEVIMREHPLKNLKHELQIHGHCQELPLALLSEAAVMEYLALRFAGPLGSYSSGSQHRGEGDAPEPLRKLAHTIYQRTDGNPLFMVNVVDDLAERPVLKTPGDGSAAQLAEALAAEGIDTPPSIVQMIERNLERLNPDEQAVLEAASVAGAEFPVAAVAAAVERPLNSVEASCTRLSRQQQFVELGGIAEWPDGTVAARFQFLHSLYRDILYDRVSPGRRVELHRRIAECEETAWGARAAEIATELAHHYRKAGKTEHAIRYLERAGQWAWQRSAFREALENYQQALTLLKLLTESPERDLRELELPETLDRRQQELRLQLGLGQALVPLKGWSAAEVGRAFNRAHELCGQLGNSPHLFPLLDGLSQFYFIRAELNRAYELNRQLLAIAEEHDNASLWLAHYVMGTVLCVMGSFIAARKHLEDAISLSTAASTKENEAPSPLLLCWEVYVLSRLGFPDKALQESRKVLALARRLAHFPFFLAIALVETADFHDVRREGETALALVDEAIELANEHGFEQWSAVARAQRAVALIELGRCEEGVAAGCKALAAMSATGMRLAEPEIIASLAQGYLKLGRVGEGLAIVAEGLAASATSGERWYDAELHRLKGHLLLKQTPRPNIEQEAESCFRQALEIARDQQAKWWELRATVSLARLLAKQGRRDEAHAMLAEIYNWFTEGFDTADLKEAKALLDELGS